MSTRPRRITLMLTTPGWRGSGTSFVKIAAGLTQRSHAVRCIAGDPEVAGQLSAAGLLVDLVPTGDTGRREVSAVRGLFRVHGPDLVICDAPRDVRIARYASWPHRRPIVWRYNLHGRRLATDVLQRWLFGGVAHIVHQSRYSQARLLTDSPWLARRPTSIIPNGFDLDLMRPEPDRALAFRQLHGIAPEATLIATPTGNAPEKCLEVAAAAIARVSATRPITWGIAAGPEVGHSSEGLRVLALGRLPFHALRDLIAAADVVLLPAPAELFNNVAAEAMALNAAVVGADAGATPEVVGDAGVLFRAGDPVDAAAALTGLLDDPARRDMLAGAARRRIAGHFPLSRMQEGFEELVRSV